MHSDARVPTLSRALQPAKMDRFRAAFDELVDKVKEAINGEPKSPVEILLDQHLSLDEDAVSFSPKNCTAVAIPTAVMNDLAARTRNIVDYPFIMERIWGILVDYQHDPHLMKKALNLLLYLLINGWIQVLKDCQEPPRMVFLESLAQDYNRYEFEQYQFSQHLDIGAGVRKTAAEIHHLLINERELVNTRRQAESMHKKLSDRGLRSTSSFSSGSSTSDDIRPPQYSDNKRFIPEDMALKIVTHPDELFDEIEATQTRAPLPTRTTVAGGSGTGDDEDDNLLKDRPPASSRRRGRRSSADTSKTAAKNEKPVSDSVDLIGLDLVAPPSTNPARPPPNTATI